MRGLAKTGLATLSGAGICMLAVSAVAQEAAGVPQETQFIFNTLSFLVHGFLVMWMAAGFAMLESGLVRAKNTTEILTKNIVLYALACVVYLLLGYYLMYGGAAGGVLPNFGFLIGTEHAVDTVAAGGEGAPYYAKRADFFFRPAPVLAGEGEQGQRLDAAFQAEVDADVDRARAGTVADGARATATLGPATVAVHDDGKVARDSRLRGIGGFGRHDGAIRPVRPPSVPALWP